MSNNIIDFKSSKKIGRNQPCPCGSGKKHKYCCYQKRIQVSLDEGVKSVIEINDPRRDSFTLDEDAKSVLEINDSRLDPFKKFIEDTPPSLYSADDYCSMATVLSALNQHNLSLKYMKRAIKKDPNHSGYYLNCVFIYEKLGQFEEAISWLNKVPDGYHRKTFTKAELVESMDGFEKAAPFYEKAVREEPDYNVPYGKLAANNIYGSENRNYWIELGFSKIPDDPHLGYHWASEKFYRNELDELVSDKRILNLRDKSDGRVSTGKEELIPVYIKSAKILQDVAFMLLNEDDNFLEKTSRIINEIIDHPRCDVARRCLTETAQKGIIKYIDKFHENLCDICKTWVDIDYRKFLALNTREDFIDAKLFGVKIFEKYKSGKKDRFYSEFSLTYIHVLKMLGEDEEVLSIGTEVEPNINDIAKKADLFWTLALCTAKLGEWNASYLCLKKFGEIDREFLINHDRSSSYDSKANDVGYKTTYFLDRLFLYDHLQIVVLMALKKFKQAEEIINSLPNNKFSSLSVDNQLIESEERKLIIYRELLNYCKENVTDNFYLNLFNNQLAKRLNLGFFGNINIFKKGRSISDVFSLMQSDNFSDQILAHRSMQQEQLREDSDYSDILNSLATEIPQIRLIPAAALKSIIEAETRVQDDKRSFDSAPTIVAYSKSLELTLRHLVFGNYRYKVLGEPDSEYLINEAKNDKNFSKFSGLIKYLERGQIELGVMHLSMQLSRGKTARRVKILELLRSYLDSSFPSLLEEKILSELEGFVKNFRNQATHERSFDHNELQFVRSKTFEFLKIILSLRAI